MATHKGDVIHYFSWILRKVEPRHTRRLERDPALRDALRRHILTDELLQVPVRLERIEEDIGALKEGQARLEEGQARLEEGQARLEEGQARLEQKVDTVGGHVSRLTGTD